MLKILLKTYKGQLYILRIQDHLCNEKRKSVINYTMEMFYIDYNTTDF